jgi:L-fuconolactonase
MKIDSHQHFWKFDPVRDAWIDETMQVLRRDYLPGDLRPILNDNNMDGCVAVQADQSENETHYLLNLAAKNNWICAVVGWVDLQAKNIEERLSYFSKFDKLKGFRYIVQTEPDDNFMLGHAFQRGIGFLKQFNFSHDILIFPRQLPAAIRLAQNHPQQTFILDHIAKPLIKDHKMEPWAAGIKKLSENPNVYCKVSGVITEADHQMWTKEEIFPYLDVVFNSFRTDRLMFGSDWPVCLLAGSYPQVIGLIREYSKNFSKEDKEKLFGGNAANAYRIFSEK